MLFYIFYVSSCLLEDPSFVLLEDIFGKHENCFQEITWNDMKWHEIKLCFDEERQLKLIVRWVYLPEHL